MTATVEQVDLLPPCDLAAEQAALGATMLAPAALAEVSALVGSGDFYRTAHGDILAAALALNSDGQPVDAITVAEELLRRGQLARVGGAPYLHDLISTVPTATNAAYYAEIVKSKALLRGVLQVGQYMQQKAYNPGDDDPDRVVERARAELDELAQSARGQARLRRADEIADAAVDRYADPNIDTPLPTGWTDIDDLLNGGLRPGTLTVIAARPGAGKSIMGVNLAVHAAKQGHCALFASLEMTEAELADRIIAQLGTVELDALTGRQFNDHQWGRVERAYHQLHALPLQITDDSVLTITAIASLARDCRRDGLAVVVVDYLQLIAPADTRAPRQEQVAGISRGLKLMAKQLAVPVVALAQLNRGSEQRADKRPTMSDLRESGAIEQDADGVWLLHHDPEVPSELEAHVVKNRSGRKGMARLAWLPQFARAASLARFNTGEAA